MRIVLTHWFIEDNRIFDIYIFIKYFEHLTTRKVEIGDRHIMALDGTGVSER